MPGAKETALSDYDGWRQAIKLKTREPALKDAANRAIENYLTSLLGTSATLVSGAKSREKEILVKNKNPAQVLDALKERQAKNKKQKSK